MKNCKVKFYKKNGYKAFKDSDADTITLENCLVSVKINRTIDTPTAEACIEAEYEDLPTALFGGGTEGIIDNFAQVKIYINDKIQFTGVVKKYIYNTDNRTIEMTCHDMYYRMLNYTNRPIRFYNKSAVDIISNVASQARCNFYRSGGTNYTVPKLECDIGTMYNDVIQSLVETMRARIRCNKSGCIVLEEQYPLYDEAHHELNHYDYEFDVSEISTNRASRDANSLKNILMITCNDKYSLYENKAMTTYLNGEKWLQIIDNPLATSENLKKKVAGYKYLNMWRNSTAISVLPVQGSTSMELGKVAKVTVDGLFSGYYLIVGVNTVIDGENYTDNLQLQGMRDKRKVYEMPLFLESGIMKNK